MDYFLASIKRVLSALSHARFWGELILILPFSMLGIWWPHWFEWNGYDVWDSSNWFTFGVGFLAVIFLTRMLFPEEEDRYSLANKIIIGALCIGAGLLYGKAVVLYTQGKSNEEFLFGETHLAIAITLTIFVWMFNFVSSNKYDKQLSTNPLGGKP